MIVFFCTSFGWCCVLIGSRFGRGTSSVPVGVQWRWSNILLRISYRGCRFCWIPPSKICGFYIFTGQWYLIPVIYQSASVALFCSFNLFFFNHNSSDWWLELSVLVFRRGGILTFVVPILLRVALVLWYNFFQSLILVITHDFFDISRLYKSLLKHWWQITWGLICAYLETGYVWKNGKGY